MAEQSNIRVWEDAERERSQIEAAQTPVDRFLLKPENLCRYLDPPAETPYPLEYAFNLLGDVTGKTVLDYGCGNGENTILLLKRKANVIGLDISEALLQLARKRLDLNGLSGAVVFAAGSAHEIPLPDESVDVVFGVAILHHLELTRAAREVHRVLKRGGKAIFQEPVRNSRLLRIIRRSIPYRSPDVSPFERPLTDTELGQFAQPFSGYKSRVFSLPFVNVAFAIPWLRKSVPDLYRLDSVVFRKAPILERFACVRVFQVTK